MTEPNGPVEHAFFLELLDTISHRLRAALPVDAVYICSHGAGLTTEEDDPEEEFHRDEHQRPKERGATEQGDKLPSPHRLALRSRTTP